MIDLNNEEWKEVFGYEGYYEVSNLGRVRSRDRLYFSRHKDGSNRLYFRQGRILKPIRLGNYQGFQLCIDGVREKKYTHRLVMEAFTDIELWCETVNHIDGRKDNNTIANLEWNTYSENNRHTRRILRKGDNRAIVRINPNNKNDVKEYYMIREALDDLGLEKFDSNISKYCKEQTEGTYKGYMWRYKEDYNGEFRKNIG